MRICSNCGNRNPSDAVYCATCTSRLSAQDLVLSPEEEQRKAEEMKTPDVVSAPAASRGKRWLLGCLHIIGCICIILVSLAVVGLIYLVREIRHDERSAQEEAARKTEQERRQREEDARKKEFEIFLRKRNKWIKNEVARRRFRTEAECRNVAELKSAVEHMKKADLKHPAPEDAVMAARCADVKALRTIRSKNSKIDWQDPSIMIAACKTPFLINVRFVHTQGGNVNATNKKGETALMWASYIANNCETVKYLIAHGAIVETKDEDGCTALLYASDVPDLETVKYLIENGANVKTKDNKSGYTALICASRRDNLETVKYLVENGADINAKDDKGKTALDHSTKNGNVYNYLNEKTKQRKQK